MKRLRTKTAWTTFLGGGLLATVVLIGAGGTSVNAQGDRGGANPGTGPAQQSSIADSKHNLGTTGPGPYRATQESRICIFCHTPHRSRSVAPLWNRQDSTETYLSYSSTTFGGAMGQPTGSSKLCLSCHDGSIALGAVVSLSTEIQMEPGHRFLDSGPAFIGTNLADDHPFSFDYAASKGGSGDEFLLPGAIIPPVHLDENGLVQCTSCHDPHNNFQGNFLHATDLYSALCQACHVPDGWLSASHSTATATWSGAGVDPWPYANYDTVAENACANCHHPHNAGHPQRLLVHPNEEENCLHCHNGNVASKSIESDLSRPFRHSPYISRGVHDPVEDFLSMPRHSECEDCHDPHEARAGDVPAPGVPGPLLGARGVDSAGQPVDKISFSYELCYRCHADNHGSTVYVSRTIQQANTRLEFNPANPSYHPIEAPGANPNVPSLLPPWTTSSMVVCTDCHQSNTSPDAGGMGAAGPHGSVFQPLLIANYTTRDNTLESPTAYALCYRCHSRESILDNDSFERHKKHVEDEGIPCSACHDSHGISLSQGSASGNTHLINFDSTLVSPSPTTGQIWFRDDGIFKGACSLLCHGEDHDPFDY